MDTVDAHGCDTAGREYVFDIEPILERRGMDLAGLKRLIGAHISPKAWVKLEQGRVTHCYVSTISLMCNVLNCEPNDLFRKV